MRQVANTQDQYLDRLPNNFISIATMNDPYFYLHWEGGCIFDCAEYLPKSAGVYVVTKEQPESAPVILYVGQSVNLHRRWTIGHHMALEVMRNGATTIRFLRTDRYDELEKRLIWHFRPQLNSKHMKAPDAAEDSFLFDINEWAKDPLDVSRHNAAQQEWEALIPF